MGTLYRRYPAIDALILHLCLDGMQRAEALADAALRHDREPSTAFREFMYDAFDAGLGAFAHLAGTFEPTDELLALADRAHDAINRLLAWTQTSGAVRDDITAADLLILLGQVRAIPVSSPDLVALQQRSLALALQAVPATNHDALPEPSATWEDIKRRWGDPADRRSPTAQGTPVAEQRSGTPVACRKPIPHRHTHGPEQALRS